MNETTLHYIYDPLCGWCYGAAPLLKAAVAIPELRIELHAGGLWLGGRRQAMGQALRDYVRPHDERIQALTGQPFGERYFNELLLRDGLLLDSEQPIRAILAVKALGGNGLSLLHHIQQSHYRDGIWIGSLEHLTSLAAEQNIGADDFVKAYQQADLASHLADSQRWMRRLGGQGYPTLGLVQGDNVTPLSASSFLGEPEAFARQIQLMMNR
ncbi:DsbA family protein [Aeromonas hydrophila]|uniref:DsbA family protein n=1 Tax=Aeromonas hydrophila TaxID=644 RepID=UPI002B49FF30|nr:DsbA family protein [Aeromonas hydrophila]